MDHKGDRVLKFCKTLDDILKCPVCDKKLTGNVHMCGSGHSICNDCQNKGTQCTKCNAPYTKMRNLLLQELLIKLSGIKMSLIDTNNSKAQSKQDKTSVGVDDTPTTKGKLAPNKFRCWIINDCEFVGCLAEVIEHFQNVHPLEFEEHPKGRLPFKQNWQMNFLTGNILNRAFKIAENGVFILHISKNADEEMSACILMYARNLIAFQHSYKIEIECNEKKLSFNGQVESARTPKHIILDSGHKCLVIDRNEPLYNELREKLRFKCSIMIKKDESTDTTASTNNNNNNNNNNGNNDKDKKNDDQQSGSGQRKNSDQNNQSKMKNDSNKKSARPNKSGIEKKKGQQKMNRASNKQLTGVNSSGLKKENNQKNQQKMNVAMSKHLAELKSLVEADIDQSIFRNQIKASPSNVNSFTKPPEMIYQAPYIYSQFPQQSNQLYPNLGGCGSGQELTANYCPPIKHEIAYQRNANVYKPPSLIDNNSNGETIPSAPEPYARTPPVNPHFQQRATTSSDDGKEIRKGKENDKCLLS